MPRYDYRCAEGHTTESVQPHEVDAIECLCGRSAQRVVLAPPQATGFAQRPTREAPINLTRYMEAQGEIVQAAERHGIEPPDLWGAAKERVRRGDAVAIE